MNHYPHHIGDFAKDTLGFNQGAIGAYRLLMDAYYANEEAPAAEDVYVIGRATTPVERKNVEKALSKFELKNGRYYHKRVEEELSAFQSRSKQAKENIGKRYQKGTNGPTESLRNEVRTGYDPPTESLLASNHKPEEQTTSPKESVAVFETSGAPEPPHAPPAEFAKPTDALATTLHGLTIAARVQGVRILHAQQWVADGVSEEILRAALDRGRQRKNGQAFDVGWLNLMIGDVRAAGVGYDQDAAIAKAMKNIAAKEAKANATH